MRRLLAHSTKIFDLPLRRYIAQANGKLLGYCEEELCVPENNKMVVELYLSQQEPYSARSFLRLALLIGRVSLSIKNGVRHLKYREIADGIFIDRPNRFVAHVNINGIVETVHVKNTGRCKELLLPGASVRMEVADNPNRKTKYDLVAVHKQGLGWVNMDSQAPNKVVAEWLALQGYTFIKPEYPYGRSRIDFYMEKGAQKYLMEVKGCTLEIDGIGYFPDAPTERGVKHLHELAQAQREGYQCAVAFVIQMEGITEVRPNIHTQPEFGAALTAAKKAGVQVLFLLCRIERDTLEIIEQREG